MQNGPPDLGSAAGVLLPGPPWRQDLSSDHRNHTFECWEWGLRNCSTGVFGRPAEILFG